MAAAGKEFNAEAARRVLAENFAAWILELDPRVEEVGTDRVRLVVPASDRLCRQGGIMCGQALISAADTAMVLAVSAARGRYGPMTTVDLTVNYMRPVIGSDAVLEARVMRLGKTLAFATTEIAESKGGRIAAFATGTFALL